MSPFLIKTNINQANPLLNAHTYMFFSAVPLTGRQMVTTHLEVKGAEFEVLRVRSTRNTSNSGLFHTILSSYSRSYQAPLVGFEPTTNGLEVQCSVQIELQGPV